MNSVQADWASSPEWWTAIGTLALAVGTFVLAILAIFSEKIQSFFRRPRLDVSIECVPPHCHRTVLKATTRDGAYFEPGCYYFRLVIRNSGNKRAEQVEVWADRLRVVTNKGESPYDDFLPMNLIWSHVHGIFMEAISPGMNKYCDLGHIVDPAERSKIPSETPLFPADENTTVFSFDVVETITRTHLVPPGEYTLQLKVAAANSEPIERPLTINLSGRWYESEQEMFARGVRIKLANA